MISYNIAPKHLNKVAFVKMISFLKETRVKCKHTKDKDGLVMEGVPNKIGAEALKIVINSIYGKLGSELFFLYDRFAQMQVTINGQLMTMTLVEELELMVFMLFQLILMVLLLNFLKINLKFIKILQIDGMNLIKWELIMKNIKKLLVEI